MTWQPIDTAPKDASWFLVWAPAAYEADVHVARWTFDGFLTSYSDEYGEIGLTGTPTHWMPLPEPPASGMDARQGGNEVPCEARQPDGEAGTP